LVHALGGEASPRKVYDILADYFKLTGKERTEMQPSGINKKFDNTVAWARNFLCEQGSLDRSMRGVWKITEKGRKELSRLGLIDRPFPVAITLQGQNLSSAKNTKEPKWDNEELLELILEEISPNGPKKFPDDFLDHTNNSDFYEICLPGTPLQLAPLSRTVITSPKEYFRYQSKNPSEAKYILYMHNLGVKKVKIPQDNLSLFKAVTTYEKYCDELFRRAFEIFLEFTYDEDKSERLTKEIATRLQLKPKL